MHKNQQTNITCPSVPVYISCACTQRAKLQMPVLCWFRMGSFSKVYTWPIPSCWKLKLTSVRPFQHVATLSLRQCSPAYHMSTHGLKRDMLGFCSLTSFACRFQTKALLRSTPRHHRRAPKQVAGDSQTVPRAWTHATKDLGWRGQSALADLTLKNHINNHI